MRPTPSGRQPHSRSVVGASIPARDNGYASAGAPKGFPLTLWKLSGTEAGERLMGTAFLALTEKTAAFLQPPLSRRIRSLSFFPCMNHKNFL